MKKICLLILILFTLVVKPCRVTAQVNVQDSLALVDFFNSVHGSTTIGLDTSWLIGYVSNWTGITVMNTRVTGINLSGFALQGTIPASFGNLTGLVNLDLSLNSLTSNLDFILKFPLLSSINLSDNQFSGRIPPTIGNLTNLTVIDFSFNQLIDSIPASIGNLNNLSFFNLTYNQIYLNIPSSIGNLVNLTDLEFSYNQLTGIIPTSLSNLINLTNFRLDDNQLSGNFPTYIQNLVKLKSVYLNNNKLTGNLPPLIGNLASLYDGQFGNNLLTGNIPASMGNLSSTVYLTIDHNQLTGSIPATFKNLVSLQGLGIENNQLSGGLPVLAQIPHLVDLEDNNNDFTFDGAEEFVENASTGINGGGLFPEANLTIHSNNNILSVYAGGTLANNVYKWYNGTQLAGIRYGDSTFAPPAMGSYTVQVTNSVVVGLTLYGTAVNVTTIPAQLCPLSSSLVSDVAGTNYQWQVDSTGSYVNLSDNNFYSGTKTSTLTLTNIPTSQYGYQYRCIVDGNSSAIFSIQFVDQWTGADNNSIWEDTNNWSCGSVPDANTDVIINSGTVVLSSNAAVRSLNVNSGASFTIVSPFNLTVTH